MFAETKRAKQKLNKRKRSCYANTDEKKIWAITINYYHQTFSNCLAAFKELYSKNAEYLFSPTASDSLSFFHSSVSPTMQKTQSVSHPLDHPCLFLQASQVGQQIQDRPAAGTAEGFATMQAEQETPCAQTSRATLEPFQAA